MASKSAKLMLCTVCGVPRPHFLLEDEPENDADGRVVKRMRCGNCGAHTLVPDDQHDQSLHDNSEGDN